jgi:transaldolase
MKLFVDTANLEELEQCLKRGFPSGVTTNPSILSKEQRRDFRLHINDMIRLLQDYEYDVSLSVEVFSTDPDEMCAQAEEFLGHFGHYPNICVKVPIGWDELAVIAKLRRRNIKVNCTCCMSYNQAIMAAQAGANYVSLFWGRIRDIGYDAGSIVRQVHSTLREWNSPTQIIVGSIRHIADINEAMQAGADIVTVPPKFFPQLCAHPKTDEAVNQFVADFAKWQHDKRPAEDLAAAA